MYWIKTLVYFQKEMAIHNDSHTQNTPIYKINNVHTHTENSVVQLLRPRTQNRGTRVAVDAPELFVKLALQGQLEHLFIVLLL